MFGLVGAGNSEGVREDWCAEEGFESRGDFYVITKCFKEKFLFDFLVISLNAITALLFYVKNSLESEKKVNSLVKHILMFPEEH
jgi:hypothetical protein